MTSGFFTDSAGRKSSTRLIGFIVVIWALVLATAVVYWGRNEIIIAAASAGTIFTTIAGPTLLWMYQQKSKNETNAS